MSAVVKTTTPFVIEEVLMLALEVAGAEPQLVTTELLGTLAQRNQIQAGDILINRSDYNGRQFFRKLGDRWSLLHDSDELSARVVSQLGDRRYTPVTRFLTNLSLTYDHAYQRHLENLAGQERVRLENERKARVEATRLQAIAKAKAQGYTIKETSNSKGQIQLVLTRMA